jgi:hypothetical protein
MGSGIPNFNFTSQFWSSGCLGSADERPFAQGANLQKNMVGFRAIIKWMDATYAGIQRRRVKHGEVSRDVLGSGDFNRAHGFKLGLGPL